MRLSEWEQRYRARESKREDLELIKELKSIVQQQKMKMKDLIVRLKLAKTSAFS